MIGVFFVRLGVTAIKKIYKMTPSPNNEPLAEVKALILTWVKTPTHLYHTRQYHTYTKVLYCLTGEATIATSEGIYQMSPNQLVIVRPLLDYLIRPVNDQPLELLCIDIGESLPSLSVIKDPSGLLIYNDCAKQLEMIARQLAITMNQTHSHKETILQQLINVLFALIINPVQSQSKAHVNSLLLSAPINAIKMYIDYSFKQAINLQQLAQISQLSPSHLSREFKCETGYAPMQYTNRIRLEHAAHLLHHTPLSLPEIADRSGFRTTHNFNSQFKRLYQMTPRQFRKLSNTRL